MRSIVFGTLLLLTLAGCATVDTAASEGPCLADTPECVTQRTAMVKTMTADPRRAWIGEPVGPGTVASGVRLFAYQNVRDKLNCQELAAAVSELDAARQALASGPRPGQTMARHNDIKALTADVHHALANGKAKKCGGRA